MSVQPVDPLQPPDPVLPDTSTSVQTQAGLVLTAVASLVAFIFHKDFTSVVPSVTILAFAIYGAAASIARAWKVHAVAQATVALHSMKLGQMEDANIQAGFDAVSRHNREIERRLQALESLATAAQPPAGSRTRARKTSATRRTATAR